jgi:hypothetical protein
MAHTPEAAVLEMNLAPTTVTLDPAMSRAPPLAVAPVAALSRNKAAPSSTMLASRNETAPLLRALLLTTCTAPSMLMPAPSSTKSAPASEMAVFCIEMHVNRPE